MALHRKQRGVGDTSPQYVRIPTSGSRAVGYSLHGTHPRAQRVYAKRYASGDRSRNKISSLQLRACFVLCVLLYFGAIYFADDIASIGRVVGSEQNTQSFFVHSLRPRGRGNMRVGRAVDAKKLEATTAPLLTAVTQDEVEQQQKQLEHDYLPTEAPNVETQFPMAEVATTETEDEAQATEPIEQRHTEPEAMQQDEQNALNDAPGDAVHPDDQGDDIPAHENEYVKPAHRVGNKPSEQVKTISAELVNQVDSHQVVRKREEVVPDFSATPQKHAGRDQPHPTAAFWHPEKEGDADTVPAASPSRIKVEQHIRGNTDGKPEHLERHANGNQKTIEDIMPVDEQQEGQQHLTEMVFHGQEERQQQQPSETTQPVATPAQSKKSMTEHISDI